MRTLACYAFSLCAFATLLAACSRLQPPIGVMQSVSQNRSNMARTGSWMLPQAKSEDLLYVSDQLFNEIYVFTYPDGRPAGTLTGFSLPEGLCSDGKGDVFVTDLLARDIVEYAHGGTSPIRTLKEDGNPEGCSVDPTTGNLAVANYQYSSGSGNIAVFQNAQGTPVVYSDPALNIVWNCGYDDTGNLFADGQNAANQPRLAELPNGAATLKNLTLERSFDAQGSVQWDGRHIVIMGDRPPNRIYRLAISGSQATIVGSTTLSDASMYEQVFWIHAGTLTLTYIPKRARYPAIGFWRYPDGGEPTRTMRDLPGVYGVTISVAAK